MRLDKLLAHAGLGTRKEVKKLITAGEIAVNGETIKKPGFLVDSQADQVTHLNYPVNYQEYYYVMLNKPDGLVSATQDNVYETVVEWVELDYHHVDLFPVGRLDVDTTGLLLLTNDGQLAHQLTSPKKQVPKTYWALVEGQVDEAVIQAFNKGMDLGDFQTLPAELEVQEQDRHTNQSQVLVTIYEGKFHQVKRMFEKCDCKVLELHRLSMGSLVLDEQLDLGDYRELTPEELELLEQEL
ncbi:pseudouridine synthase [Hutsoniella sourekii]|uniref:pseudouridine synthase n=1 Tax=Hutsoniella sourekii TaxID=87650 RepID=UPI000489A154|nr:pseudouridine synthase [Hutsoniella sourekii]